MKSSVSRAVGAFALVVSFLLPIGARSSEIRRPPASPISTPPGSAERIAKMEAELKTMEAEAAKNPSRPPIAALQRNLEQMVEEQTEAAARRSGAARREWIMRVSLGLNAALALALLGALSRLGKSKLTSWRTPSAQ
jgi:hypothetical protein